MERQYKDSGIEWIGRIPEDWKIGRFKFIGSFVKGKLPSDQNIEQNGTPIIGASEMLGSNPRTFTLDNTIPFCDKDSILILWDGANAGIVANNCTGAVSSTAVRFNCIDNKYSKQYVYYLLKYFENYFKSKVNGTTIPHMNQQYIDDCLCLTPPLPEQQRIASYLDKKCGEIDALIALQEKMIAQLTEYKQAVITEAVTKGLDPNAKLIPSGIEWIGDVPEGWKVCRMKFIGVFQNGLTYTPYDVCGPEGILVLRSSNIQNSQLCFDDNVYVKTVPNSLMVKEGDIIICSRNGSAELIGKSAMVERNINASFGAFMVRFRSNIVNRFSYYLISTVIPKYKQLFTTTTINQLTKGMLSSMVGILPPLPDQQRIASYLDTKCSEIDSLITLKRQKIESLNAYKKSIIYEAVTGKTMI